MNEQFTLGDLIRCLEQHKADKEVTFDFGYMKPTTLNSWRGDYSHIALGYSDDNFSGVTVGQLLERCKDAVAKTFEGYKGGDYRMSEKTRLWVANYGEACNTAIVAAVDGNWGQLVLGIEYKYY